MTIEFEGNGTPPAAGNDDPHISKQIEKIKQMANQVTEVAAAKLIEQSAANVRAAEDVLRMLKEEHQAMAAEVLRRSKHNAERLTEYLSCVHAATQAMARHREAMIGMAQAVANGPETNDEDQDETGEEGTPQRKSA